MKKYIFTLNFPIKINAKNEGEAWDKFQEYLDEYPIDDDFDIEEG